MAWRCLVLLTVAFGACTFEPVPKNLYIESRFSDDETDRILAAIGIANRDLGEQLLGGPVIEYAGRFTDDDGWSHQDFGDDVHVIYKVEKNIPDYQWLAETIHKSPEGYGTASDILFFVQPGDGFDGSQGLMLHEIGHFLGMMHSPVPEAVMHTPHGSDNYTESDFDAFCLIYRCE
jgi:hypothetical protein